MSDLLCRLSGACDPIAQADAIVIALVVLTFAIPFAIVWWTTRGNPRVY